MGSRDEEEVDQFFDTPEEFSELSLECCDGFDSGNLLWDCDSHSLEYKPWIKIPDSVNERRSRLLRWMDIISDHNSAISENSGNFSCSNGFTRKTDIARITEDCGTVLRTSGPVAEFPCNVTSVSFRSNETADVLEYHSTHELEASDDVTSDDVYESLDIKPYDNSASEICCKGSSDPLVDVRKFTAQGSSPFLNRHLCRDPVADGFPVTKPKLKPGWLRRLSAIACIAHAQEESTGDGLDQVRATRTQRISVYSQSKRTRELSSLYGGQEFIAHEGSILAMKFSPDGQYLASAGEDAIVRVWKVIEEERQKVFDITEMDPSSLYFSVNDLSELSPLTVGKEKLGNAERPMKLSDMTCVVFPPNVFYLMEKPLHEFHGHNDDILDLSWSRRGNLLSSSLDKTVRLWQVGCDRCLRIFLHSNFVTSVEFNPVDDNYFISGSIDGKVRIWEVFGCQVVDWTDIREIVTAVSYRPDGKGGIVGTVTGNCCFYDIADNQLQLDTQTWLQGKKRLPSKRITGLQFSPADPSKLLVTSADSHARILSGFDVICKFKGLGSSGCHVSACFSMDGRHIVSTGDDSSIHVWNHTPQEKKISFLPHKTWPFESFLSQNASIAVPWPGSETRPEPPFSAPETLAPPFDEDERKEVHDSRRLLSSDSFNTSPGSVLEPSLKGSATWPEETLLSSSPVRTGTPRLWRSGYRLVKTACNGMSSFPHKWGMVIVTAGWDGRIRTFHNYGLPLHL